MEVLLIAPPFKGLLREPLGLSYLATVLNRNGISTHLIDFNVEPFTRRDFRKYIRDSKPRIVGLTSFTFNFSVAKKIIEEIKHIETQIMTVIGGVHASAMPEKILTNIPSVDFVVVGEGEVTFLELCRKFLDGESVKNIRGIAFGSNGKVTVNPSRVLIEDLDELPPLDRELLPVKKYPIASVQTSRGCPYNCIFCNINRFYGKKFRLRNPKGVGEECESLIKKFDTKEIFFFGDSFTLEPNWVEEFCDEINRRDLKFTWGCETRVDNVSLSLLKKMRKAGCVEVQYGIDYGDEEVLKRLGKNFTLGCVADAVNWAKKAEIFTGGFFIFNNPGENEKTMENTFNLIQKVPVDAIEVNLLTPYPGTPLWNNPNDFDMKIIENNFDYYTTKKYVMENNGFPKNKFVPAFKSILKRLNMVPSQDYRPEIYDFLKKDIKPKIWKEDAGRITKNLM